MRLKTHIESLGYSFYSLQEHVDIPDTKYFTWNKAREKGGRRPTDTDIRLLAAYKPLGLTEDRLKAWRIIDQYTIEQIRIAYNAIIDEDDDI